MIFEPLDAKAIVKVVAMIPSYAKATHQSTWPFGKSKAEAPYQGWPRQNPLMAVVDL